MDRYLRAVGDDEDSDAPPPASAAAGPDRRGMLT